MTDDTGVESPPVFWNGVDAQSIKDWFNAFPLAQALYIRCEEVRDGGATCVLDPPPRMRNPTGSVNGGHLSALADHVAGLAVMTALPGEVAPATAELSLHFLRAARATPLVASAKVVRQGRRIGFVLVEVADAEGRACLTAMGTWVHVEGGS